MLANFQSDQHMLNVFCIIGTETLRRILLQWHKRARASAIARQRSEEKARQDRLALLTGAWDRWRLRAKKRKLASLVCRVSPHFQLYLC